MTNKDLINEAVKIIKEDAELYEACEDGFTARDIFFMIDARFGVQLSDEEIAAELVRNDSVESFFRLKWEPMV